MYLEITLNADVGDAVYKVRVTPHSLSEHEPYCSFRIAAYEKCEHCEDGATWLIGFECHGRALDMIEVETSNEVFEYLRQLSDIGPSNKWAYIQY